LPHLGEVDAVAKGEGARMTKHNHGGEFVTHAEIQRNWDILDRMPHAVRAAIWDGMQPWAPEDVAKVALRKGVWGAIKAIFASDRTFLLEPGETPHRRAGATQLRSFAHIYLQEPRT
jgi:hypothetical protein